jgi:hypothetical protein
MRGELVIRGIVPGPHHGTRAYGSGYVDDLHCSSPDTNLMDLLRAVAVGVLKDVYDAGPRL